MAKQNGTMLKIDEDFMREVISQGVPGKLDGGKPDDMPQEAQAEKPTPRKRKNSPGDYREEADAHRNGDRRAQGNGQQLCGKHLDTPFRAVSG